MELCLGTVQFGLDYGIIGQKKPPLEYAVNCLDYATQNGIAAIDTAAAYGNAEEVVGAFLKKKTVPRDKLFISTKLRPNSLDDISASLWRPCILRMWTRICSTAQGTHSDRISWKPFMQCRRKDWPGRWGCLSMSQMRQ